MKKITLLLLGMFLMITVSCAHTYNKLGATEADFNRDKLECEYQADSALAGRSGGSILDYAFTKLGLVDKCLRIKGWTLQ